MDLKFVEMYVNLPVSKKLKMVTGIYYGGEILLVLTGVNKISFRDLLISLVDNIWEEKIFYIEITGNAVDNFQNIIISIR